MATRESIPILVLGPEDDGRLVSAEEFAEAECLEPWTYEREEGRLIVMAPDGHAHIKTSNPWRDRLVLYKLAHPEVVEMVNSNAWIRVHEGTDRIADLGVYLTTDRPVPDTPDRVPELVFEVVSGSARDRRRDYEVKRAEYERLGVREYVVIDRFQRRVTVLSHGAEGYEERVLTEDETYTSDLLPGLVVRLAEVWAS